MPVHVAMLFLLPAAVMLARMGRPGLERPLLLAAAVLMLLFTGLRWEVGGDWDAYLLLLQRARISSLGDALAINEPGFMLLNVVAARLGLGLWAVNLVCAALFFGGLAAFALRQPSPALAFAIAVPVLILVMALNATRQSAAVGLFLFALARHDRGAHGQAAAAILLALLFHWTALVLLPFVAVMRLGARLPFWLLPAGAAGVALLLYLLVPVFLGDRLARLSVAGGAWARAIPTVAGLLLLAAAAGTLRLDGRARAAGSYLAALAILSVGFLPWLPVAADRIGYYVVAFQMWLFPRLATLLPAGRARLAAEAVMAAPFFALAAAWLALSSYRACVLPWRSYLEVPERLVPGNRPEPVRGSEQCALVQDHSWD